MLGKNQAWERPCIAYLQVKTRSNEVQINGMDIMRKCYTVVTVEQESQLLSRDRGPLS